MTKKILERKNQEIYRYQLENELKECGISEKLEPKQQKMILDHFFGYYDGEDFTRGRSRFKIIKYSNAHEKQTIFQRLMMIPVYLIVLILIAPFKWIITGDRGIDNESILGKSITFLIGDQWHS